MINPYKRSDIFKCNSSGHEKFGHKVSAYYVLRVKKCYPQGCLYFKWFCQLLNKGKTCKRGYKHVGKKCFGCKYYYDEKINNQPVLTISEVEYNEFLDSMDEFEDWLDSINQKNLNIEGKIQTVKPALSKTIQNESSRLRLYGFFIHFDEAFIDRIHWEDHCYAFIYPNFQQKYKFAPGDKIDFRARVELDNGRLVFKKINSIEFLEKSNKRTWDSTEALIARHTAFPFDNQHQKCLHCQYGMLIDVTDKSAPKWERGRELICLKSVTHPKDCIFHIEEKLVDLVESCP
ncbi:hypothetical protein H8E88_33140, partial [candidate division KSB1 bacterium]|nr:hypothetical protein [candidate division KSB1 bacterium]